MKMIVPFAAAVSICSIAAWTTAAPAPSLELARADLGAPVTVRRDSVALASGAALLRTHDPFRLARKPADSRYNPWEPVATIVAAPAPVRPLLAVVGLVGGPPWNALIEGIPGRETGVLLQLGDSASGVRFIALRGDTVVLAGFDTTWSLTARRAWR